MIEIELGNVPRLGIKCHSIKLTPWIPGRLLLSIFFILAIGLSGCSSPTPSASPTLPTSTRTPPGLGPSPTPTELVPTDTPVPSPPTAEPIPPTSSSDWVRGPDDAEVTILVYSDFQ